LGFDQTLDKLRSSSDRSQNLRPAGFGMVNANL
jgi:hypothetical protein